MLDVILIYLRDLGPPLVGSLLAYYLLRRFVRREGSSPSMKLGAGALAATLVVAGFLWSFRFGAYFYGGSARAVAFAPGAIQVVDVVPDLLNGTHRVVSLDPKSGRRLAREMVRDRLLPLGETRGLVWYYGSAPGLHARDPATAQTRVDEEELGRLNPALAGRFRTRTTHLYESAYRLDRKRGGVWINAKGGGWLFVDGKTLRASPRADEDTDPAYGSCKKARRVARLRDGRRIELKGKRRRRLLIGRADAPEPRFVLGRLLVDGKDCRLIELGRPPSVLVIHRASLDARAERFISRVGHDGRKLWSFSLGPARGSGSTAFIGLARYPRGLVLVTSKRALTLRPEDASPRWTHRF